MLQSAFRTSIVLRRSNKFQFSRAFATIVLERKSNPLEYDVVVIGGGHAGCEAVAAAASSGWQVGGAAAACRSDIQAELGEGQ